MTKTIQRIVSLCLVSAFTFLIACANEIAADQKQHERFVPHVRQLLVRGNMILDDDVQQALDLMNRAAEAGFTDIVLSDSKTNTWFIFDFKDKWQTNITALRAEAQRLGLNFHLSVLPYGYCTGVLGHDVNLAEGTPVLDAPLRLENNQLLPMSTATLSNPSFEIYEDNRLSEWFQDEAGSVSFIDTDVVKDGGASLRLENFASNDNGMGRVIQSLAVEPFKQYRLRVWMKAENYTGKLDAIVKSVPNSQSDSEDSQGLLSDDFTLINDEGKQTKLSRVDNLSFDWTEFNFAFNSLNYDEVKLVIGAYQGETGKLWIDGIQLEDVPTLNVLRRDDLPLSIRQGNQTLLEGQDFTRVQDPNLGIAPYLGKYGVAHDAPVIEVLEGSSLIDLNEPLYYSGYHALLIQSGHVTCSLSNEAMFEVADTIVQEAINFKPDGLFLGHSEIRSGGWQPDQALFDPAGQLLSLNVSRSYETTQKHLPDKPVYMWADMLDPYHNARALYYQMRGDLSGSWTDVPRDLRLVTWWSGSKIDKHGAQSLQFFAEQGFKQIIGGYYNDDVVENYQAWQAAAQGVGGLEGVMFATWNDDYSELEAFADLWWGDTKD